MLIEKKSSVYNEMLKRFNDLIIRYNRKQLKICTLESTDNCYKALTQFF